jgi:glycyl-tRNA synthetase
MVERFLVKEVSDCLRGMNKAFEVLQVEAPILTPLGQINPNYTIADFFGVTGDELALRPETTAGSYMYAEYLLAHTELKTRLPLCIWQHGKSFRREQNQITKNMRLKEFYQLEFQCIYAANTANDYSKTVIPTVQRAISQLIGPCRVEDSDRLPDYSERTVDVICEKTDMEVCSISLRKDFPNAKVLEVAVGTDRCVYNFLEKNQ